MDVHYNGFVWDEAKAESNLKKHGISFLDASYVFFDPTLIEFYDRTNSTLEEERFNVIGSYDGVLILFVTSTERNGETRIISARRADKDERRIYYENKKTL